MSFVYFYRKAVLVKLVTIYPRALSCYFKHLLCACRLLIVTFVFPIIRIIGVQKPGSQYSPAMEVYTLHSIVMVLLYYIYLLGIYHWLLSLILSVHFRNLMLIT